MVTVALNQVECVYVVICYLSLAEGQDFTLSRSEVTFDQGAGDDNGISVFFVVFDDLLVEGTECLTLSGSIGSPAASGSTFVGGDVTVCIADNDCKFVWMMATDAVYQLSNNIKIKINNIYTV